MFRCDTQSIGAFKTDHPNARWFATVEDTEALNQGNITTVVQAHRTPYAIAPLYGHPTIGLCGFDLQSAMLCCGSSGYVTNHLPPSSGNHHNA